MLTRVVQGGGFFSQLVLGLILGFGIHGDAIWKKSKRKKKINVNNKIENDFRTALAVGWRVWCGVRVCVWVCMGGVGEC